MFVDLAFGPAVERFTSPRQRLWNDFGVGGWGPAEPVRFDATADITQAALAALMLVLGRNLRQEEYPEALPSLLMEIVEVAQIRGSSGFAGLLQRFFQRSLPLPGRRPFANADEALGELRQIVRRDIGLDACRQAVVDFAAQMDAGLRRAAERELEALESAGDATHGYEIRGRRIRKRPRCRRNCGSGRSEEDDVEVEDDAEDEQELELSLEQLDSPAPRAVVEDGDEIYELSSDEVSMSDMGKVTSELASYQSTRTRARPAYAATPEPEPERSF